MGKMISQYNHMIYSFEFCLGLERDIACPHSIIENFHENRLRSQQSVHFLYFAALCVSRRSLSQLRPKMQLVNTFSEYKIIVYLFQFRAEFREVL